MKYLMLSLYFWLLPLFLFAQEYEQTVFLGDTCWLLPDSMNYKNLIRNGQFAGKAAGEQFPAGSWLAIKDYSSTKKAIRAAIERGTLLIDSTDLVKMEESANIDFFRFELQDNIMDGPFSQYDEKLRLRESGHYQEGRRQGVWKSYNDSGNLIQRRVYAERLGEYELEVFYTNGQAKYRRTMVGVLDQKKLSLEWYENGQLKEMGLWQRTNPSAEKEPYEKIGEWVYYYANGFMEKVEPYRNGKLHGWVYLYDENGLRFGADSYKKGVLKVKERYLLPERDGVDIYEVKVIK